MPGPELVCRSQRVGIAGRDGRYGANVDLQGADTGLGALVEFRAVALVAVGLALFQ